jgi:hypothetical protein
MSNADYWTKTGQKLAGSRSSHGARFLASERDFTISGRAFSIEEIAQIAALIVRGGKGKTAIVQAMPRYSGRKRSAYAACYDRLRAAIDATLDAPTSP